MAQAVNTSTTRRAFLRRATAVVRLSTLIRDPVVRAAFERAERDYGQTFAIPDDPPHTLNGGAAELRSRRGETERFEVGIGQPDGEGFAPGDVPWATAA